MKTETPGRHDATMHDAPLTIGGRTFQSRLMVGTGKYPDHETMLRAIEASDAEIVTVAVRRVDLDRSKDSSVLHHLDPKHFFLLANTAGCYTAEDAIRYARLGREAGFNDFVKLEVIGDQETLLPDVQGLLEAAKILVKEGFKVLAYTNEDLVSALRLEDAGCAERPRPPQSVQRAHDQAPAAGARRRRRGRRHGVGCLRHDGTRRGRHPDEYGDRRGPGPCGHGARDAARRRGGARRIPRRPDAAARGGVPVFPHGRNAGLGIPRRRGVRRSRSCVRCARVRRSTPRGTPR